VIRAVLDTNLFVSMAIRPGGVPDQIRLAWQEGGFTLLTSPPLLAEIRRVLAYPRLRRLIRLPRAEEAALLGLLVEDAEITAGALELAAVAADPTDNMVLACALEGHAHYIVSGDTDLLSMREYGGIPIITARAFLDVLEAQRRSSDA
jgi:putative PIN family toxin of toxin-antitoxin system